MVPTTATVHYIARKTLGEAGARTQIERPLGLFEVASVARPVVEGALAAGIRDFEVAVVHEAARLGGSDGIVTRNTVDFTAAALRIYSPAELVSVLRHFVSSYGARSAEKAKRSRAELLVVTIQDLHTYFPARAPRAAALPHERRSVSGREAEHYTPFDVHSDGQHFIMARRVARRVAEVQPLVVTENWFTEFGRILQSR